MKNIYNHRRISQRVIRKRSNCMRTRAVAFDEYIIMVHTVNVQHTSLIQSSSHPASQPAIQSAPSRSFLNENHQFKRVDRERDEICRVYPSSVSVLPFFMFRLLLLSLSKQPADGHTSTAHKPSNDLFIYFPMAWSWQWQPLCAPIRVRFLLL